MKLTKSVVDRLALPVPVPPATKAQAFYRDDSLRGFAVRVTSTGVKTFVVEKRVNGRVRRSNIGRYGPLTVEQARKQARTVLAKMANGIDVTAEKREAAAKAATLREAFAEFLQARQGLKPKTVRDYQRVMSTSFADWQRKAVVDITKDMVERRHRKLGEEHGHAWANLSMRVLRAVLNFAAGKYEDAKGRTILPENPVKRLSHTRAWYRVDRRRTYIKPHELRPWFNAVTALASDHPQAKADIVRDYLLFILFTGLRRQEAARLRWEDVDLKGRTLTVTDTKNHQPHTLPLSEFLLELLTGRHAQATSEYVFPGDGEEGYLVEPRRQMEKVAASSEVSFTVHDLRRTFITVAESLDIPAYALKRLLNHKMGGDVTAGYIVSDVERLRKPMQQIADFLLSAASVKPRGDVVRMGAAAAES
jgi:integrase